MWTRYLSAILTILLLLHPLADAVIGQEKAPLLAPAVPSVEGEKEVAPLVPVQQDAVDANKNAKEEKEAEKKEEEAPSEEVVLLSVIGPEENGVVLQTVAVPYETEDTAFSVLQRYCREQKIPMSFSGKGKAAYVEGIDNIFEFDYGPGSGWVFQVNGVWQSKGCATVALKSGDTVAWYYTKDLGQDVGAIVGEKEGESSDA